MNTLAFWIQAIQVTLPPAAKVLAIVALVYPIIQALKRIPALTAYLTGWWAIALNVLLSAGGILIEVPADQLYTTNTLLALVTAILGAAGIHGTVSAMSRPQMLVTTPPATQPHEADAVLQPKSPGDVALPRDAQGRITQNPN
jgi:hypothetical protein